MVYYFKSNVVDPPAVIYMGKDKFENETLIEHAWDIDVWFHVDNLSSAHLYLRLAPWQLATSSTTTALSSSSTTNPTTSSSSSSSSSSAVSKKKTYYTPPASKSSSSSSSSSNLTLSKTNETYGTSWTDLPEVLLNDLAQLTKANSIEGCKKDQVTVIYTPASNLKKTGDMLIGQVSFHNDRLVKKIKVSKNNDILNRLNKTKVESFPDLKSLKETYVREQIEKRKQVTKLQRKEEEELRLQKQKEKELCSYDQLFQKEYMKTNKEMVDDDDDFM